MMHPTRPVGAIIAANRSANNWSVCSELTPGAVSPFAHFVYAPELLAKPNVPLTLRRAARYRLPPPRMFPLPLDDASAALLSSKRGDRWLDYTEVFLVLEVNLVPRRVGQHAREAARPAGIRVGVRVVVIDVEDVGELQVPVEEAVLFRRRSISVTVAGGMRSAAAARCRAWKTRLTIAGGASSRLIQTNAAHQASAISGLRAILLGLLPLVVLGGLLVDLAQRAVGHVRAIPAKRGRQHRVRLGEDDLVAEQLELLRAAAGQGRGRIREPGDALLPGRQRLVLRSVRPLQGPGELRVVALDQLERARRDAAVDQLGSRRSGRCPA